MESTHTFELEINGFTLQGELSYSDDGACNIKVDESLEMSLENYRRIGNFLDHCNILAADYGEIKKIEIVKKV